MTVSKAEIIEAVKKCNVGKFAFFKFAYPEYEVITEEEVKSVLREYPYWHRDYRPEYFDCDDFSYALMGMVRERFPKSSFFIVYEAVYGSYYHALNGFYDGEKFLLVEPQGHRIYEQSNDEMIVFVWG